MQFYFILLVAACATASPLKFLRRLGPARRISSQDTHEPVAVYFEPPKPRLPQTFPQPVSPRQTFRGPEVSPADGLGTGVQSTNPSQVPPPQSLQGSPHDVAQGFPQQGFPAQGSPQHFNAGQDSSQQSFPPQGSFQSSLPAQGSFPDYDAVGGAGGVAGPSAAPEDLAGDIVEAGPATLPSTPIWGNRPVAKHFDSSTFCRNFMIPSETPISSYATMRLRFYDNYDIMRCLVAAEIIALPHNLIQDVRWSFTQISRQSDPLAAVGQVAAMPFLMARSVAALPVRVFAEFYQLSRRFLENQHEITRQYIKK